MHSLRIVVAIALLASGLGCAFTRAVLDIRADPASARVGLLSSVPPLRLSLVPFADTRWDPARIGSKKSGYGDEMAPIESRVPVEQVVRDAVRVTFERNGHAIAEGAPLRLEGEITEFWLDTRIGLLGGLELAGTVTCEIGVVDAASGGTIHRASYTGHAEDTSLAGYEKGAEVMNTALARFAESLAFDAGLAAALKASGVGTLPGLGSPASR